MSKRVRRWWAAIPATAQDGVIATGLCLVDLLAFSDVGLQETDATVPAIAIVALAAAGYVALIWRRQAPLWVFGAMWVHALIVSQMPRYQAVLGLLLALYTVASRYPQRVARYALLLSFVPGAVDSLDVPDGPLSDRILTYLSILLFFVLLDIGAWGTGRYAKLSQERTAELEYRRDLETKEAVARERGRIARELHDIVSHSVTVMVLQAAAARRTLPPDGALVAESLDNIGEQGKQAMQELRRMLLLLQEPGEDEDALAFSQLGVDDIGDLVAAVERSGVDVEVEVEGEPGPLTPSVDLAAYRAVQEALTNVTKHASGARATVRFTWAPGDLMIEIRNTPGGENSMTRLSTGSGLSGLRQRIGLLHGHLEAAPAADGGFAVTVVLPRDAVRSVAELP